MPGVQNQGAKKLLRIIRSSVESGEKPTYREVALRMGRTPPQNHSRAVAQMCNFLDAAACLAGVPLLALVAVRENSREVNSKAWESLGKLRRDSVINRSLQHHFRPDDFKSISTAINELGDKGRKKAWDYLDRLYPGDLLYRRLMGRYTDSSADTGTDAINDLGTDSPDRVKSEVLSYARDPKVREAVLRRANGACEFCSKPGFVRLAGGRYLETHHIIALAKDGADRVTNVIALCPNDHREAHFGEKCEQLEQAMMARLRAIGLT